MKYLLDTCVLSELVKKKPDQRVVKWIASIEESKLFISVLTIGEIHKGIEKMPKSKRREMLLQWVDEDLQERFRGRTIPFDLQAAAVWGKMQAKAEMSGKTIPIIDGMIAATAITHNFAVATRNISDMEASKAVLVNPWDEDVFV
ncbi:MAG: type II toxin-antitoxin system VapC family toxin [Candidatus Electrothrix sp. GM3_4]|nr:type II toxin-antitoxin system VapC family toxin [Candidatus Electrothrix sp. GM3_4]